MKGLIIDNEIKYYRLDIDAEETTILISVTPLNDGDPDLIVNQGLNKEWPDLFIYDYGSKNTNADQVSIFHKRDHNNSENNSYVIGVYGKKNCSFVLTATYGDFHLVYLHEGSPNSYFLKAKEKIYFKYNRNYPDGDDFRMILSKDYGDYLWAMRSLKDNEDLIENMPDFKKNNYIWSNEKAKNLDHIYVQKENENFCNSCSYILMVEAETESKFTILISGLNQTIYLQDAKSFKDFIKAKGNNAYVSYFYEDVGLIEVNILVYQGKITAKLFNSSDQSVDSYLDAKSNDDSNNILMVYEPRISSEWYFNMVAVSIYGETSSNYTISIYGKGRDREIRFGITEYGEANPFTKYNFNFYSNSEEENEHYFSVTLKSNVTNNKTMNFDNSTLRITFTNKTIENLLISGINWRSDDYIYFRFKGMKGDFVITVDNSQNMYGFSFNLLLSFAELDLIYPDTLYMSTLLVQTSNYYQLLVENEEKVLVELFQCTGKNKLYVTSNQNDIESHQSELKPYKDIESSFTSNHLIKMYDVKNLNEIFIEVNSIEGRSLGLDFTSIISSYQLKTHGIKLIDTPYDMFHPGNDGQLNYIKEDNKIKFMMRRLTCGNKECKNKMSEGLLKTIKYYQYSIKIEFGQDNLEDSVTCFQTFNSSLSNFFNRNITTLEGHYDTEYIMDNLEVEKIKTFMVNLKDKTFIKDIPYYAKAYAQVFVEENNGLQPYIFFYKTVEFYPGDGPSNENVSSGFSWILIILMVGFLAAIVAVIILFKKYKKTEKQLNYELQDVTKVARLETTSKTQDYIGVANESYI